MAPVHGHSFNPRAPENTLEVDIAGWYSFQEIRTDNGETVFPFYGEASAHKHQEVRFPFRHVSGPLPGYTCGGEIYAHSTPSVENGRGVIKLYCNQCHFQFEICYPVESTFEGAHYKAFLIAAYKHYTKRIFPHPDHAPFELGTTRDCKFVIRGIDPSSSPDLAQTMDSLMRWFLDMTTIGANILKKNADNLEDTRRFFPNKRIGRVRDEIKKLATLLQTPTPAYLRRGKRLTENQVT